MTLTKIRGKPKATKKQMMAYLKKKNPNLSNIIIENIVSAFIVEGFNQGIRADIAFAQSCLQTGNFSFKGSKVTLSQNNFAGIGVTKRGKRGNSFPTIQIGVRAQIQHLKAYASTSPLNKKCVDPRYKYVKKGCAPFVEFLGIHQNPLKIGWASGKNYGQKILKIVNNILSIKIVEEQKKYIKKYDGKVTAEYLNVRKNAGTEYETVTFSPLKKNTLINIYSDKLDKNKQKWYYISYGKQYGYVNSKYIEIILQHTTKQSVNNYLAASAKWAQVVYNKIVQCKCKHKTGSKSFNDIINKKITNCNASVSAVLQQAGCLQFGKNIVHTKKIGGSSENILKNKDTIEKSLKGLKYLIPNTYDIIKIGKNYNKMSNQYKKAGIVYIQDDNLCICAGGNQIWSTNKGPTQYNGYYFNTLNNSGYSFNSIILYAIVPKENK